MTALRRTIDELSFLQHLAQVSSAILDPDALCQLVIRETCDVLGVEVCSLYAVEEDEVVLIATNGLDPAGIGRARMPVGVGITGEVARSRSIIAVRDVADDPRFHWIDGLDQERFTSMCSVPLISGGTRVAGVLNVQTELPHEWTSDEQATLTAIAAQLAGTIERSYLQTQLERRLTETHALAESRSDLMSAVSHDLRTPLTVVLTYLHALRDELTGAQREVADQIMDEVDRMERLVDTILTSLAMEAGALPLRREPTELNALVSRTCAAMEHAAGGRLDVRVPPAPIISDVDPDTVRRVLENLVTNAIRHAPGATPIAVTLGRDGLSAVIAVRDHGPGIPGDQRSVIFERFRRGRGGSRGTGVGLFVVRTVVEAHGGQVGIDSPHGGGARIWVRLPVLESGADTADPSATKV